MSNPRADIPRENSSYFPASGDGIRQSSPYAPVNGNAGAAPRVPVMGIAVVAGVILLFEHFRNKRGK